VGGLLQDMDAAQASPRSHSQISSICKPQRVEAIESVIDPAIQRNVYRSVSFVLPGLLRKTHWDSQGENKKYSH
jgi:hypothetical protein